jgi:hypothetical protein
MHDLVPDIDRRAELRQRPLDNLDCPVYTGAKSARLGQQYFLFHTFPCCC